MDPDYYSLIELAFTGSVVLGFAAYQLWTVMPSRRGGEPREPEQTEDPGDR